MIMAPNSNFNASPKPSLNAQVAAALDWWRDAGVDCDFSDEPAGWLTAHEASESPSPGLAMPPPPVHEPEVITVAMGGARADWPQDLAGFQQWWLTEPSLDGGQTEGRVGPRGAAGAELMILVDQPEADDFATGHMLSGHQGQLLAAMLAVMGIGEDQIYLAAALPRHTPMPDWESLTAQGLGPVLCHHVALARPKRIVTFGLNISPLIGHDPTKKTGHIDFINHPLGNVAVLAARNLAAMLERPGFKAGFWQDWLGWNASGMPG